MINIHIVAAPLNFRFPRGGASVLAFLRLACLVCGLVPAMAGAEMLSLPNRGSALALTAVPAPAGLPVGNALRYFATPAGDTVALANRLILVTTDPAATEAHLHRLAGITARATLAHIGAWRVELLQARSVAGALKLVAPLSRLPGVACVQPDVSQNVTRHGAAQDWEHFDLAGAIGLEEAWRVTRGEGVRVAVIDDGIDLRHRNLRRVAAIAGFDADQPGRSAVPAARENHGTRVAGVIFSERFGVAPAATLVPIRLRSGWSSALIEALEHARATGADVVNLSWTFPLMLDPVARMVEQLAAHGRHGKGTILVVAAGNRPVEVSRPDQFPAYPGFIAATATDHGGAPAGAAYGPAVFIAAPGMLPTTSNRLPDAVEPLAATSAAAAVVSGVAALVLAAHPGLARSDVLDILAATAGRDGLGDHAAGRHPLLGAGRIHAGRAVAAAIAHKENHS